MASMALRTVTTALAVALVLHAVPCIAAPGRMRGSAAVREAKPRSDRTVSTRDVESSLSGALEEVFGGGAAAASRLGRIEASMWQTYQALPKNSAGRLGPRAVRHIIHSYFAKEHGWLINGLEHHGMQQNVSEVHEVDILQDKAPAFVEALLEARRAGHGLSLDDVVAMAAALERLIVNESLDLLQVAYVLNEHTVVDKIDAHALHHVLSSYLLIFELGTHGNDTDVQRHGAVKKAVTSAGGKWPVLAAFGADAVRNHDFESRHRTNPFAERTYSFGEASRIVEGLAQDYGMWQNTECRQMKEELMSLDPDGSGHVPLKVFYSQPPTADYQFTESVEYLRTVGALDESTGSVRIANYMAGPSNCIASSTYYSVCCLSDCEGMMNELEGKIQAPAAAPEHLLAVISNLSTSAGMRLPEAAASSRLREIAGHSGGQVPLHGRLFAEFLHRAFPAECPYPHVLEDAAASSPGRWTGGRATASREERRVHLEADDDEDEVPVAPTVWSDEELLPVRDTPRPARSAWSGLALWVVLAAAAMAVLRSMLAVWRSAMVLSGAEKEKGYVLPLRI
jgi:hypothetical protein